MYVNDQGGYRESFQVAPPVSANPAIKSGQVVRVEFRRAATTMPSYQNCAGLNLSRTTSGYSEVHPPVLAR